MSSSVLVSGTHGDYHWLVAEGSLDELLEFCPEIVLGKVVAVVSFDSGPLELTVEEIQRGWQSDRGIAYSPKTISVQELPFDNCYDEWCVLQDVRDIGWREGPGTNIFECTETDVVFSFVNRHFGPDHEDEPVGSIFWRQIERIGPISYLADNSDQIAFATLDSKLFEVAKARLSRS